jgi:hypothetical protein
MDWKCGSRGNAPALQAQSLSSNPSPTKNKKRKWVPLKPTIINEVMAVIDIY